MNPAIEQLHLVDMFLGGNFVNYGLSMLGVSDFPIPDYNLTTNSTKAIDILFPTITECDLDWISQNGRYDLDEKNLIVRAAIWRGSFLARSELYVS